MTCWYEARVKEGEGRARVYCQTHGFNCPHYEYTESDRLGQPISKMDRPPSLDHMLRMMACHAAVVRGASSEPAWRFYQVAEEYYELWRPFVLGQYPIQQQETDE